MGVQTTSANAAQTDKLARNRAKKLTYPSVGAAKVGGVVAGRTQVSVQGRRRFEKADPPPPKLPTQQRFLLLHFISFMNYKQRCYYILLILRRCFGCGCGGGGLRMSAAV